MLKPLHLLLAFFAANPFFGQKTDTLYLHYKPDQFTISLNDMDRLDSFLLHKWDRIIINGYTDETETEEYNMRLSKKRAGEAFTFFRNKNVDSNIIFSQWFGESMPQANNSTTEGRALNRRTMIVGFQLPRATTNSSPCPKTDPMTPVTRTLDNGFIITYKPGAVPGWMSSSFEFGSGADFQLITNTVQMQQNNLYNNTTTGDILSSVLIICNRGYNPCKLESPVEIKVPLPYKTKCPIEKVRFYNSVLENGKRIWQEQAKQLFPETINGVQYIRLLMDDFCQCINFDFKIDPECFDTDSTKLLFTDLNIKYITVELKGLNSVYLPNKTNDSTYSILFLKDKLNEAAVDFVLYAGKRRIRGFMKQSLETLPYDEANKQFIMSTDTVRFYFTNVEPYEVLLKVNGDKYRVMPDKNKYEFIYLKRRSENILVDFSVMNKKNVTQFKNQPIGSMQYDEVQKAYVIDKKFLKAVKQKEVTAKN